MNILEILILGAIFTICLIYVIFYVIKPFKENVDPCENCPYSDGCKKKI